MTILKIKTTQPDRCTNVRTRDVGFLRKQYYHTECTFSFYVRNNINIQNVERTVPILSL